MILSDNNIRDIIDDRWLDRLIENTKSIIRRYSKQPYAYWFVVKRYSKLLSKLTKIKEEQEIVGTNRDNDYN